jgi:CheY-like chemotaxis protein
MVFGVSCPACNSTSVLLGSPAEPSAYHFRCHRCGAEWAGRLPLEEVQPGERPHDDPSRPPPHLSRILVLDDEPEVTAAVGSTLSDLGDVYTATTSAQAITLARVVPRDVAEIDVILPRMDGFQVVEAIRRIPGLRALPVIFITGSDRIDIGVRVLEMGMATVLYKPLDEDTIRDTVNTFLRRARAGSS